MAKRTKAQPPATPTATPKAPGVIAALTDLLRNGGGTVEELYTKLAERFPDRASAKGGMRTTVSIQVKRLHKTGKLAMKVEGRGAVYSAE
jgi:hypothetical protein